MARRMNKPLLVLAIVGFWLVAFSSVEAIILNASIVNTGTGAVSSPYYIINGEAYLDLIEDNPEYGARVCSDTAGELNNQYVTFAYKVGNTSRYIVIAGQQGVITTMTQFTGCDATKCCTSPANLDFSDMAAYYPGYLYAVVSADGTVDMGDNFIWIPSAGGWLQGSYTSTNLNTSYNQASGNVTLTVSSPVGTTSSSSYSITKDASYIVVGICDAVSELQVFNCSSSATVDPGTSVSLHTGVKMPADTAKTTKTYLINGINGTFCIGPDLKSTSVALSDSIVSSGESITVTATVNNVGNVNVTQNFKVGFFRDSVNFANSSNIAGLVNGTSTTAAVTLDTTGLTQGSKTIRATILDKSSNPTSTIEDCYNGNDNSTTTLTVSKAYSLSVYINSTLTDNFTAPGIPYNITINVSDTDGSACANLTLKITEKNGMNLFAPTQGYLIDTTKRGVVSYSIAEVFTNESGVASFALIPTGNKLYLPEYAYMNVTDYVGNYSLYIELFDGATELQLQQSGALVGQYNLSLESYTPVQPSTAQQNTIYVTNQGSFVQTIISFFNQVYSGVYLWLGA